MKQSKKYLPGYFYLGDINILYKGMYCEEDPLWNGWMSPYFDEETTEHILKSYENENEYGIVWHKKGDKFYYIEKQYLNDGEDFIEVKPTIINGKKHYDIGAWEWIWDKLETIDITKILTQK